MSNETDKMMAKEREEKINRKKMLETNHEISLILQIEEPNE